MLGAFGIRISNGIPDVGFLILKYSPLLSSCRVLLGKDSMKGNKVVTYKPNNSWADYTAAVKLY